ncbi:hypothetical protein [Gryllotalpicola protaetiae]|nr:hypothetical protein [Gryllotalpicola protaetiae]
MSALIFAVAFLAFFASLFVAQRVVDAVAARKRERWRTASPAAAGTRA